MRVTQKNYVEKRRYLVHYDKMLQIEGIENKGLFTPSVSARHLKAQKAKQSWSHYFTHLRLMPNSYTINSQFPSQQ